MKIYPLLTKTVAFVWVLHRKFFVSLLVSLALLLLILRAGALYLEHNPQLVKDLVATHLQTTVDFDELKVGVHLFFPSVSMRHFSIENKQQKKNILAFNSASVRLNLPLSILQGKLIIDSLALKGFSALVHRNLNNEISIAEFQLSGSSQSSEFSNKSLQPYFLLLEQSNFVISDSEIHFVDEMQVFPEVIISDIDFKMKNKHERHQVSLLASLNRSDTQLDFRLDFKGKINDISNWNGKVYSSVENVNRKMLLHFLQQEVIQVEDFQLESIRAKTNIWSSIHQGNLHSIHGELYIDDVTLNRLDNNKKINFNSLSTNFKLVRNQQQKNSIVTEGITGWGLDLFDMNFMVNSQLVSEKYLNLQYKKMPDQALSELQIFVNKLELDAFSSIISFFSPMEFNKNIYSYLKPRGRVENILSTLQLNTADSAIDIKHYQVQADINGFGFNSLQALPKIRNFSAQLILNDDHGRTIINSTDMKIHLKSLFRDSWPIKQFSGDLYWQKEADEWLFGGENLLIKSPHFERASADLQLWFSPVGEIFMDLQGYYEKVDVSAVRYYLPAYVMSQGLVEWLDMSLISGQVPDGGIVFRGQLDKFPYLEYSGNMDIVFNTHDVLLEYLKDWPKLRHINSQIQFTQKGMRVDSSYSQIYSAESHNVQVVIDDYLLQVLNLSGDIKANITEGRKYLKATEFVSQDVLDIIDAEGDIDINLKLKIPMDGRPSKNHVTVKLKDVDYYPPGFTRTKDLVSRLNGDIIIDNKTLNSRNLSAQIMQLPAAIKIKTRKPAGAEKNNPDADVHINIDTQYSIKQLEKFQQLPASMAFINQYVSGRSTLKVGIDLPNNQHGLKVSLNTDLKDISSSLPPPFNKKPQQSKKFLLTYAADKTSKAQQTVLVKVNYENDLSMIFLLGVTEDNDVPELLRGNIAFAGEKAQLPVKPQLKLSGSLKGIPFKDWQKISKQSTPGASKTKTQLLIPIELAMTELVLPELELSGNNSQATAATNSTQSQSDIKPEEFPLLNGYIESLKLGELDLGRFTIQSSRVDKDIVFDSLTLEGNLFAFNGSGKWHRWNGKPEVDIEGSMEIPSLEEMAIAFGNDQLVRGGKATISGYLSWPGSITNISKTLLDGRLTFNIEQGAWIEGKPGAAGRLLGLLNMNALARRLSLDFSDVSDKGFEFDKIEGDFRFKNATAYTDNLRIFSPSAKILVTGSTGLVSEEINQRVTVIPELSASLPLAGAAVAGPAGAAVVWLGQRLLGDQLNKVTAFDYTITGNWNKPIIKRDKSGVKSINNLKQLLNTKDVESANSVFDINSSELP